MEPDHRFDVRARPGQLYDHDGAVAVADGGDPAGIDALLRQKRIEARCAERAEPVRVRPDRFKARCQFGG